MQEEIGLALDEDRHDTGSGMDTTQAQTIIQNYANRSSGTWDLNIEETNKFVTEQFEQTSKSLKVSYDVTFKHDVSLEHDVFIDDINGHGTNPAVFNKPEIKLNEFPFGNFDEVIDLYDNVEFYTSEVNKNKTVEIKEESFSKEGVKKFHTYKETAETEVQSSKIKRNISDSYLEVADTVYHHDHNERNENSNSFENVVLKLKGFLNERFKGDESRSEAESSDEYLTAETDFDSMPRYSDKYGRHRLVKRQSGNKKIGYISSSENDSFLSDISNLESDFSDCRSLTSEEVKTTLPGSLESKHVNGLEYQTFSEGQENVFRDKPSEVNEDSNFNPSFIEPLKDLDIKPNVKVLEVSECHQESTETGFDFSKYSTPEIHIPLTKNIETKQLKTVDKSVDYQADVEKSLQRELDKFNLQINEIESSVRPSSVYNTDEIDGCILENQEDDELLTHTDKISLDQNFVETPDLFTGLEDVESLLKRSLHEFSRSLSEPEEHEIISQGTESVFEWDSVNRKEKLKEFEQQNDDNKYFAVLGISSVEPANQTGRRKGRSLSNPEIPVLNWKFSPENEEDTPTEMVVGPYASMSNSYNENWNSSVFVEQNTALKQRVLDDHLCHSKEKFEKSSVDLVSSISELESVSSQIESREIFDSVITKTLFTGSPEHDFEALRPCPSMKSLTKDLEPSPVVRPPPQVISPVSMGI